MATKKKKTEEEKQEAPEETKEKTKPAEEIKKTEEKKEAKKEKKAEAAEKKEETEPQVSKKIAKLLGEIETLTVVELADLVKALEDKFGVSTSPMAAPTAPAQAAASTGESAAPTEGKNKFTVVLTSAGSQKIQVIKALRSIDQSLGLKEAKDKTESTPAEVLVDAKKEEAEAAKKALEEAGATVELK